MAWNEPGGGKPNDPWGNKNKDNKNGNNQGPPDLDEAIKQVVDKISGLFGGKGNGSGGNKSAGDNGPGIVFGLIVAIFLGFIYLAWNSAYTLNEQERGVVLRMGKYERTEIHGLHFKIPLLETVTPVNVTKVRNEEIEGQMLTKDENIVEVALNVQYRVTDPVKFALRIDKPESTLSHSAASALRHEVGSADLDHILTKGRQELGINVKARLQEYIDRYQTGITLENVNVKGARAPKQVQAAFDDVQKAKQDKDRYVNQAEAYANTVVPEARGKAQRMTEEAKAYKEQVIAEAEGEAYRFEALLKEYKRAPKVTRERLYLDAISEVYSNSNKVLVDVEGGNNMMYLPLDQLAKQRAVSANAEPALNGSNIDINLIADKVVEELRQRSDNRKGAR
jgi:membrane protease subunit HflK